MKQYITFVLIITCLLICTVICIAKEDKQISPDTNQSIYLNKE